MQYKKFLINKYKAITQQLVVDVEAESLIPIIGVNECGKTTILQAVFAFDYYNDKLNQSIHMQDVMNLYRIEDDPAEVGAEIQISWSDFDRSLEEIKKKSPEYKSSITSYRRKLRQKFTGSIVILRNLKNKNYSIKGDLFDNTKMNDLISREILRHLPYLLYFDDFRDSIGEKIEIERDEDGSAKGWLAVLEQLFRQVDPKFSVFKLKNMEERQRKSALSKVKGYLNRTLTKEWQNFRLDDREALQIHIEYLTEKKGEEGATEREYLKLEVIETDMSGEEHYFFIRDRSKGFFWFFNFVMKLEFNPKTLGTEGQEAIYLLDEPGSYLHASAQMKLCKKLRQLSARNKVIYCTHSHYLLNPEIIPLNHVKVADKDGNGNITLVSIYNYKGNIIDRRSAFQPILDALQIKPFLLDISTGKTVVITEGIYDYYALDMFKEGHNINLMPSVGANSIKFYVSLMIAWRIDYRAIWDNDEEGRKARNEAGRYFGLDALETKLRLLPKPRRAKRRILQNLFAGKDVTMIKERLKLPKNISFEKTILTLYYSDEKASILSEISPETKRNFAEVFGHLKL